MGTALKYHCDELYYNSKAINKLQKMLTTIKAKPMSNIRRGRKCKSFSIIILEKMTHLTLNQKTIFLTYNDPQDKIVAPICLLSKLVENFEKWNTIYGTAGKEVAPTTGTIHYHVLLLLENTCRTKNADDILTIDGIKPHLEKIRYGYKNIIKYCQKENNYVEIGKCPYTTKEKEKKEKNMKLLNGNLEEMYTNGEIGAIDVIRADKLRGIFAKNSKQDDYKKKTILWFRGQTGEGKTRTAIKIAKEYYEGSYWISNDSLKWFDGYNGQKVAILDDFRKSMLTDWNFLLRLLDGYNLIVQVKGGFVKWNPELIIITSPASPEEAFQWINKNGETEAWDKQDQLERRLACDDERQVYEFPLWEEEEKRLEKTIRKVLGLPEEEMMIPEEEWSTILPEGFITPS